MCAAYNAGVKCLLLITDQGKLLAVSCHNSKIDNKTHGSCIILRHPRAMMIKDDGILTF